MDLTDAHAIACHLDFSGNRTLDIRFSKLKFKNKHDKGTILEDEVLAWTGEDPL